MNRRSCIVRTSIFWMFLFTAGSSIIAEPSAPQEIPGELMLEVVTAPGYSFMDGCADPEMMSAPVPGAAVPAAGAGDAADHTAHHPGGTAPAQPPAAPEDRETVLAELEAAAALFGSLGSEPSSGF